MSNPHPKNLFQKGNKIAKGNDKTIRLSTWIDKALDGDVPTDVSGYDEIISYRQFVAAKMVETTVTTKDPSIRLAYFKEIADRTEGRPSQPVDLTSKGERIFDGYTDEQLRALAEGRASTEG